MNGDAEDVRPGPPTVGIEPPQWLSGRRRALAVALYRVSAKTDRALRMYVEALQAIDRNETAEALHIAAYELREFMDCLLLVLEVPADEEGDWNSKATKLAADWRRLSRRSRNHQDGVWSGEIDEAAAQLLEELNVFVKWTERFIPSLRERTGKMFHVMRPTDHPMPAPLVESRTKEWSGLLRYFNKILHHGADPDPTEFLAQVESLEVFLLETMEPRVFKDQDAIDELIQEAEGPP